MSMSGMDGHDGMMNMTSTMNPHMGHSGSTMDPHMGHGTTMNPHSGHDPGLHGGTPVDPNSTDKTCQGLMMMYFHTGKCEYVLFEALRTTNAGEMIGACFAIFAVALLYEGLKVLREYLLQRSMVQRYAAQEFNGSATGDTKVLGTQNPGHNSDQHFQQFNASETVAPYLWIALGCKQRVYGCTGPPEPSLFAYMGFGGTEWPFGHTQHQGSRVHMISAGHFIQTLLHMLQVFISYCLMLVFMTYNAWLCIAVVVGAGAGYFLFGWRKAIVVDINEHCH